jgi:Flp pilus assembly protein TadD
MQSVIAVREAVSTLLHDADPVARAQAHTTLGRKAIANDDLDTAAVHLREAYDLDPTDEIPRQLLESVARRQPAKRRWMGWLSRR